MDSISPIDWAICGCYLALVIGLGLFFSNKQKDNDDFFFGGRNMHWLPVWLSLFATTFSSNSLVGLPAEGGVRRLPPTACDLLYPFWLGVGRGPSSVRRRCVLAARYGRVRLPAIRLAERIALIQ